jgi:hypothetical protein
VALVPTTLLRNKTSTSIPQPKMLKPNWPNTYVMLKQEIIKIPEYFGKKAKDTSRNDECQVSSHWNNTTTFPNF